MNHAGGVCVIRFCVCVCVFQVKRCKCHMRKNFQSSSGSLLFIKTSTITAISERKQQQQQNIGHATSKSVIRCFHKHRFVFEEDLKQMQLNEPGGKEKSEFLAEGEACKLIS